MARVRAQPLPAHQLGVKTESRGGRWVASFCAAALTVIAVAAAPTVAEALVYANMHPIEGYADRLSVVQGGKITFFVHVPSGRTQYTVTYIRYGRNDAAGDTSPEVVQGPVAFSNGRQQNYTDTAYRDGANWVASFEETIPETWSSGLYAAKLSDPATSDTFYVTFVVADLPSQRARIALVASTNTWEAYNHWPGDIEGSFYGDCHGSNVRDTVSFLRPNPWATPLDTEHGGCNASYPFAGQASGHLVAGEVRVARWLQRNGYRYSMLTDWDLARSPGVLDPHVFSAVIVNTHSEYWSQSMYEALRAFYRGGGNIVSLSGNTGFRTVSTDDTVVGQNPSGQLIGNRTMTRLWGAFSPTDVWPQDIQARTFGLASYNYSDTKGTCAPYKVLDASNWIFDGSGAATNELIGTTGEVASSSVVCGVNNAKAASGWEVDRAYDACASQYNLLARGQNTLADPAAEHADVLQMSRVAGGQVFSVGSIMFGQSLMQDARSPQALQRLTPMLNNVLRAFQTLTPAGSFADLNGDSWPDVIGARVDGTLWLYPGTGAGLGPPTEIGSSGWDAFDALATPGDFNADGCPDLVVRQHSDGTLRLYGGDGRIGLIPARQIATGWSIFDQIIGTPDFDGDGYPDLVAHKPTDGSIWLYSWDSLAGRLSRTTQIANGWYTGIVDLIVGPGDFDGDGHADLIARHTDGTLWLLLGNGAGGVYSASQIATGWGSSQVTSIFGAGDFDGDGHRDLIVRRTDGTLWVYRGNGMGGFLGSPYQVASGWKAIKYLGAVDSGSSPPPLPSTSTSTTTTTPSTTSTTTPTSTTTTSTSTPSMTTTTPRTTTSVSTMTAPPPPPTTTTPTTTAVPRTTLSTTTSTQPTTTPSTLIRLGRTVILAPRRQRRGCVRGTLPDRRCSPGAYYSGLTKAVICSPRFRKSSLRNVPQSEEHAVEREYGMQARSYGRTIEIDHIVPLELGGSSVIDNLYPEPGAGPARYHVKDRLENRLRTMVCRGQMPLTAAQRRIASNWEKLYERIFRVRITR